MQVATARNGMHRNGRSDRTSIWFPFTECLGEVVWGKGVTEWNEQNWVAAWSGLRRCMEGLAIFCIFFQHKKYSVGCICQATKSNVRLLLNVIAFNKRSS